MTHQHPLFLVWIDFRVDLIFIENSMVLRFDFV